eukprot:4408381-Pleurochrysis_carterae.AAC.3
MRYGSESPRTRQTPSTPSLKTSRIYVLCPTLQRQQWPDDRASIEFHPRGQLLHKLQLIAERLRRSKTTQEPAVRVHDTTAGLNDVRWPSAPCPSSAGAAAA